jgi:chromosome partitioning protein
MAHVVAVSNLKGGTGKSTIAVNLACARAGSKRRVVLIDADAQGTASQWAAQGALPIQVEPLPLEQQRDTERWVARVVALRDGADLVVIDCPPHIGAATSAAFLVADLVVIPVTASGADLLATTKALDLLREARTVRQDGKPACLMVPSRVDRRTGAGREIEAALNPFGEAIGPAIGQRSAFVDAFTAGQWIGQHAPNSKANTETAALAAAIARRLPQ